MNHIIVGLAGKAGVGKDTVAKNFIQTFLDEGVAINGEAYYPNPKTFAFATRLKEAASRVFDIPLYCFNDPKLKETEVEYWGLTPRQIAQMFGTESMRHVFGANFWVKVLARQLETQLKLNTHENTIVFITDCRFDNEVEFVLEQTGMVVEVKRESFITTKSTGHISENGITYPLPILQNDTVAEATQRLKEMIVERYTQ